MSLDDHPSGCDCFGCKCRSLSFAESAMPNRSSNRKQKLRPMQADSYGKQVVGETRNDGSFMPYLTASGEPMHRREADRRRHEIEATRDAQRKDPNPRPWKAG